MLMISIHRIKNLICSTTVSLFKNHCFFWPQLRPSKAAQPSPAQPSQLAIQPKAKCKQDLHGLPKDLIWDALCEQMSPLTTAV